MIDLHGYFNTKHGALNNKIDDAHYNGMRKVVVVTGQGAIMREMPSGYPNCQYENIDKHHNPEVLRVFCRKKGKKRLTGKALHCSI